MSTQPNTAPDAGSTGAGEVELDFTVTIGVDGPVDALSPDGLAALGQLMDRARAAAEQVLSGAPAPTSSTLQTRFEQEFPNAD